MSKPVAIVAAMRSELSPLLRGVSGRMVDRVELYELPSALVAIGGIGQKAAQRAAEVAILKASPRLLISAGLAGALTPNLVAGDILHANDVIDEATGEHYTTTAGGNAVLVTALRVAGTSGKLRLASTYAASAVDMEGAAVARVARQHGIAFAAVKAISDGLDFAMPPVNGFVDEQGEFRTLAFAGHVVLRPRWWLPTIRLAKNSKLASAKLAEALDHLIIQYIRANSTQTATLA